MRKKLLSLSILALLAIGLVTTLNLGPVGVSAADYPSVYVHPPSTINSSLIPGSTYVVAIKTDYMGSDITAYQFSLTYNPTVLNGVSVVNGDIIDTGVYFFQPGTFDNTAGKLSLTGAFFFAAGDVAPGPGTLATVTFTVVGTGDSKITLGQNTKLVGWNSLLGKKYDIVNGITMPFHLGHGYFANAVATHDVAVTSVTTDLTNVVKGEVVTITVDVENEGTATETFDVTVYKGLLALETKTVTSLAGGANTTLTYLWDTTTAAVATYVISAVASTVAGETDTADNTFTDGSVKVNPAIVADIVAPDTGLWNVWYTFDGSASYTTGGASIVKYTWNFKDTRNATTKEWILVETTEPTIEHKFSHVGVFGVEMWVTDDLDRVSTHAYHSIEISYPTVIGADLVKYKARAEKSHWVESKDDNGLVALNALARNLGVSGGEVPINITVTFAILDGRGGSLAGPVITVDRELAAPEWGVDELITVEIDPYDYGYDGKTKITLFAQATLTFDSDGDGTPDTDASTKNFRFAVLP